MLHEEVTKDKFTFDHDDCQCALKDGAKEKLDAKGFYGTTNHKSAIVPKPLNLPCQEP